MSLFDRRRALSLAYLVAAGARVVDGEMMIPVALVFPELGAGANRSAPRGPVRVQDDGASKAYLRRG